MLNCKDCIYANYNGDTLTCHRYAPRHVDMDSRHEAFPKVKEYDWCGEGVKANSNAHLCSGDNRNWRLEK